MKQAETQKKIKNKTRTTSEMKRVRDAHLDFFDIVRPYPFLRF